MSNFEALKQKIRELKLTHLATRYPRKVCKSVKAVYPFW